MIKRKQFDKEDILKIIKIATELTKELSTTIRDGKREEKLDTYEEFELYDFRGSHINNLSIETNRLLDKKIYIIIDRDTQAWTESYIEIETTDKDELSKLVQKFEDELNKVKNQSIIAFLNYPYTASIIVKNLLLIILGALMLFPTLILIDKIGFPTPKVDMMWVILIPLYIFYYFLFNFIINFYPSNDFKFRYKKGNWIISSFVFILINILGSIISLIV